jgi:hypothetical protein
MNDTVDTKGKDRIHNTNLGSNSLRTYIANQAGVEKIGEHASTARRKC